MEDMNEFKQFDIVSDDSDHHFRDRSSGNNIMNNTKKSIMKEWKILEQNLPESIYVRVYDQRIDLMRAVIIGAAGTPYHDGLFFFDIVFPSDYPNNPPKVHFISFGQRLNPNFYPNDTVCLSLLNTWRGKKNEKWNPSMSTCLQLLLSLQGLVLNENPFFNEPGFAIFTHDFFDFLPRTYTELVYRHTCYINMHLLQKPPKNFDTFIKSHFCNRAAAILAAFVEYATGRVRIGYYGAGSLSSPPHKVLVSRRHKKWAQKFYPSMINAFERCGASLDTSVRDFVLLSEYESNESTILTKVSVLIKKAFTWMNIKEKWGKFD
ncbi:putative ubiquitin-conjugating enzyme E2 38 [Lotus japonicus]|uniref:putative ubiquitin-conjugating enzyme E2 38 n=1 Tax=Lotus japonicus TaxID=34305 RepID=UPI00258FBD19|nr:putative ubiquitin-conjugating enzyme E2 38 [Lotus japonicus]